MFQRNKMEPLFKGKQTLLIRHRDKNNRCWLYFNVFFCQISTEWLFYEFPPVTCLPESVRYKKKLLVIHLKWKESFCTNQRFITE